MKHLIQRIPLIGPLLCGPARDASAETEAFRSGDYWEKRYVTGGNSGAGSYGRLAEHKAEILNTFVTENQVQSVIEFGCGDGNQLTLARYPAYVGVDVSLTAVQMCRKQFAGDATKQFLTLEAYADETAELALSLDVLYHLVEDEVFTQYMETLFRSASRFVIVYSSNEVDEKKTKHVRHRVFTDWTEQHAQGWELAEKRPNAFPYEEDRHNESFADFYIFRRR